MLLILPLCGEPKVRSYAIQPITVNVVNKLVWFWLQYKAMKQFFSVSLWADMHMMQGVHLLTGLQNPPFILIDAIEIFVVNIRDIALGKWNYFHVWPRFRAVVTTIIANLCYLVNRWSR